MTARNTKGLLRWILVAGAAAVVFVGCETTAMENVDEGEKVSTPTQDLIVFNRERVSTGVWKMYSNGTGQAVVTTPTGENGMDKDPVLSPDGTQIAFERNGDIWIVNNDGSELRNVSAGYAALSGKSGEREVAWSPDTSVPTIAFTRNATPQKYTDVYGLEIAQPGQESPSDLFPITDTAQVADSTPSWSPDGSEVVFTSRRKDKAGTTPSDNWDLFRTPAYDEGDISVLRRLTNTTAKNEVFPAWSPDDGDDNTPEWVAYHTQEGPKVVIRQIEGGAMGSTFDGSRPAWSIDGTQLVWSQSDNIVKVPIDPANGTFGTATDLTESENVETAPNWGVVRSLVRAKSASLVEGETIPGASNSYLEFKVELSAPSAQPIAVPYEVFEDDAVEGEDFDGSVDPLSGTVEFDPGVTQKVVRIAVLDDTRDEPEQGLELELSEPTGDAILGIDYAVGLIKDNDSAPVIEFDDVTVNESDGNATFSIDLVGESEWSIKLTYDHLVEGTTATAGSDYTRPTGTLTFSPGQTHKEITVPIADDSTDENNETFKVKLVREFAARSSFEADGSPGIATGTIEDNDGAVTPPSNEEIAFVRFPGSGGGASDIWTVPADGGSATQFPFGLSFSGYDYEPNWGEGANSHLMYFSSYNDEDPDIYRRNMTTGNVTKVVETDGPEGTFGQEDEYYPALSPDGTKLAFTSSFNYNGNNPPGGGGYGDGDVYVLTLGAPLTSTNPKQLTSNTVEDSSPAWSPDGTEIVYTRGSYGSQNLYVVPADGSAPSEQLTSETGNESYPDWSPDGETLAFTGNADPTGPGSNDSIFFMRNVGSTNDIEQVTFEGDQYDASFSPDGQELAYASDGDIVRFDIAACTEDPLTTGTDSDSQPDWKNPGGVTPVEVPATGCVDGGGGGDDPIAGDIAYVSRADEFSNADVHSMDVDGLNSNNETQTASDESEVAWNADGTKVAYVRAGGGLFVRNAVTGTEQEVLSGVDGTFLSPAWHPSEDVLAFSNFGDALGGSENDWDVYVYDFTEDSLANLMANGDSDDDLDPAWSPDGTQLAFSSDRASGDPLSDLYTMDVASEEVSPGIFIWDGDNVTQRTSLDFDVFEADWSPDGEIIAFNGFEPMNLDDLEEEIFFLEVADDTVHQVTDTPDGEEVSDIEPVFSPDGQTLLYSSDADGDPEIYSLDLSDCTTTNQLTTNTVWDVTPAWRPDASAVPDATPMCGTFVDGTGPLDPADAEIVYSKDEGTNWNLWIMNEDGSQQAQLTDFTGNEMNPVWSPDGSLVAYESDDGGNNAVFVLDPSAAFDSSNPVQVSSGEVWGDVTWTPDGKVAWVGVDPVDSDFDIYTADVDGSNAGVLVNTEPYETDPQFYDDGGTTRVLFIASDIEGADDDNSGDGDYDSEVWAMDLDGSNVEQITHTSFVLKEHLAVSTDGLTIAYSGDDGDVYTDDVDATTLDAPVAQTTDGDSEVDNQPAWSSDGAYLVYVNFGSSSGDIYKMPWGDETSREQLTSDPAQEFSPNWKG